MARAPVRVGGRRGRAVEGANRDRLSDFPDEVLHGILSFLDTKAAVRSGILSSRWRPLWKTVPALNFDGESFDNEEKSFKRHVNKLLDRRSATPAGVRHVSILNCPGFDESSDVFTDVLDSICRCDHTLETLNLRVVRLDTMDFVETGFDFKALTTLALVECYLDCSSSKQPVDPFAGFPVLKNLKLICCSRCLEEDPEDDDDEFVLKVSGSELLSLEIHAPFGFIEIRVSAPKLESFTFRDVIDDFSPVKQVSLNKNVRSLQHANIMLWGYMGLQGEYDELGAEQQYANLLLGLRSVEHLTLEFDTVEALINACDLLRHVPSPFKRLKSLCLRYSGETPRLPDHVMRFFLDGSSFVDENSVKLTKVATSSFPYDPESLGW